MSIALTPVRIGVLIRCRRIGGGGARSAERAMLPLRKGAPPSIGAPKRVDDAALPGTVWAEADKSMPPRRGPKPHAMQNRTV